MSKRLLSKKHVLKETIRLWKWLAEDVPYYRTKFDWPGWTEATRYHTNECHLCEYVRRIHGESGTSNSCGDCPIPKLAWGPKARPGSEAPCALQSSFFNKWQAATTLYSKRRNALAIVKLAEEELRKITDKEARRKTA